MGWGNLLRLHVTVLEAAVEPMEYEGLDGLVSFNDLASSSSVILCCVQCFRRRIYFGFI